MIAEQRPRLLDELRPQGDTLLGESADELGIENVRRFERATGTQHFPNHLGLRLSVGLLRARRGKLRVYVAERLRRERRVVGTDQKIGVGPERLNLRFGIGHLLTHAFDLAGEPFARGACLLLLRRLLAHQIGFGNGVGDSAASFGSSDRKSMTMTRDFSTANTWSRS
jgi:hypothetical protein